MTPSIAKSDDLQIYEVRSALQRLLASRALRGAVRCRWLLERIVSLYLDGKSGQISEKCLASDLLGSPDEFTEAGTSRIRTAVTRLRARLDRYYQGEGREDSLLIRIPKGSYVPNFERRGDALANSPPPSPEGLGVEFEARQFYCEGRFLLQRGASAEIRRAADLFDRAFALDSSLASALSGAADCSVMLSLMGLISGREAHREASPRVKQALGISRHTAEVWATLGVLSGLLEWRWERAGKCFDRALRLDPSSSPIRRQCAIFYLLGVGQVEDAVSMSREAIELAPNAARPNLHHAVALWANREYEQARIQCESTLEFAPTATSVWLWSGRIYCALGRYNEALQRFSTAWKQERNVSFLGHIGVCHARLGETEAARRVLRECMEIAARGFVPDYLLAILHLALGEPGHCLDWLERAAANLDPWLPLLISFDPDFAELREGPRGIALRRRMHLPLDDR